MLQINRNIMTITAEDIYFDNRKRRSRHNAKLSHYTHRLKPSRQLQSKQTIHVDLTQDESIFMNNLPAKTKDLLFENILDKFKIYPFEQPSDELLREFQRFYNDNTKNGDKLNRAKYQSLLLLRNKNALIITKIDNAINQTLGYRVYVVDGQNALLIHVSISIHSDNAERANLLLCWEDMKMFRKIGYYTYDFGSVEQEHLNCNNKFAGHEVTVFSGYIAKSFISKFLVKVNEWRVRGARRNHFI